MPRGRPPKPEREKKSQDLRIPVTEAQKALVAEAMKVAGREMAGWAREVLLAAAQAIVDSAKKPKKK